MPFKDPAKRKAYLNDWQRTMRANRTPEKTKEAYKASNECRKKKYAEDPVYRKKAQLRNRLKLYGLTEEQFGKLLADQKVLCALCQEPLYGSKGRSPVIDHSHETGEVRGILHNNCNIGIGMFQDDADKLRLAAAYLER